MHNVLPPAVREALRRMASEERRAKDPDRATRLRERRARMVSRYGFASRIRTDADRVILVCYPAEWVTDGTARLEEIKHLDRACELPLSGAGDPDDWDELAADNDVLADRVGERHGPDHGANAESFADFMNNHRARPIASATAADVDEFLTEYYPRNVWPSERQRGLVDASIDLLLACASEE